MRDQQLHRDAVRRRRQELRRGAVNPGEELEGCWPQAGRVGLEGTLKITDF